MALSAAPCIAPRRRTHGAPAVLHLRETSPRLLGAPVAWWAARKYVDYKGLGMTPLDPATLGWATAALAGSALLAVLGPAWRAASADPVKALREG